MIPTYTPTFYPTVIPTNNPTNNPTIFPSIFPTYTPTIKTVNPTMVPSSSPSTQPTAPTVLKTACSSNTNETKFNTMNVFDEFDEITIEHFDDMICEIGWIEILFCKEQFESNFTFYYDSYNLTQLLAKSISFKIAPANCSSTSCYDDFALIVKPCSDTLFSLHNGFDLYYTINQQYEITGKSPFDDWKGSGFAKHRLEMDNECNDRTYGLQSFPQYVYETWCNFEGLWISFNESVCVWDWYRSDYFGQDISIYLGFATQQQFCNMSVYNIDDELSCNCWQPTSCCDTALIINDFDTGRSPAIAYYKSNVYLIGKTGIHFKTFDINIESPDANINQWYSVMYQNGTDIIQNYEIISQQYTQHKESLYLWQKHCAEFKSIMNCIDFDESWSCIEWGYGDTCSAMYSRLLKVDLNDKHIQILQSKSVSLDDSNDDPSLHCIVANSQYVYIIEYDQIALYNIMEDKWSEVSNIMSSELGIVIYGHTCAITKDSQFIYIFGGRYTVTKDNGQGAQEISIFGNYNVIKYNIFAETMIYLSETVPKMMYHTKAITAPNGKMYLFGSEQIFYNDDDLFDIEQFEYDETIVFNPFTEQFEYETIDIMYTDGDVYNSFSTLAVYSDNVLLFYNPLAVDSTIYYLITDLVSINFEQTTPKSVVWPSDGFEIKYILSDFSQADTTYYSFIFYTNSVTNSSNTTIRVYRNSNINECEICHEYNTCHHCNKSFQLNSVLDPSDGHIKELLFYVSSSPINNNNFEILTLPMHPQYISITLERCHISFDDGSVNVVTAGMAISFKYILSSNCYSRIGYMFSITISSPTIYISKKLQIEMNNDNTTVTTACKICETRNDTNCSQCKNSWFSFVYVNFSIYDAYDTFIIEMKSNTIDLVIDDDDEFFFQFPTELPESKKPSDLNFMTTQNLFLSIGGILLLLAILSVCIYVCVKRNLIKRYRDEMVVKRAMVVLLAIGDYDSYPDDPDKQLLDVHLSNLDIEQDIVNLYKLFGPENLNYTIYPKYENLNEFVKTHWTQKELIDLLTSNAKELNAKMSTDDSYDCLIVAISCHGMNRNICTSDYKCVEKLAVHRLFTTQYPSSRQIPRIFLFDCCEGVNQQETERDIDSPKGIKSKKQSHTKMTRTVINQDQGKGHEEKENMMNHIINNEQGKHFGADDIIGSNEEIWVRGERNPDHALVQVHAANPGFQSKCNSETGSYMLYEFAKKTMDDLDKGELCIYEIFDDIQEDLETKGKQQIVTSYANQTRYIKFVKNDYADYRTGNDANRSWMEMQSVSPSPSVIETNKTNTNNTLLERNEGK
eukprot:64677_1